MKKRNPNHFTTKNTHIKKKQPKPKIWDDVSIGIMCLVEYENKLIPLRNKMNKTDFLSIPISFNEEQVKQDIANLIVRYFNWDSEIHLQGSGSKDDLQQQVIVALIYYARLIYDRNLDSIRLNQYANKNIGITYGFKIDMVNVIEYQIVESMEPMFNDYDLWLENGNIIMEEIKGTDNQ